MSRINIQDIAHSLRDAHRDALHTLALCRSFGTHAEAEAMDAIVTKVQECLRLLDKAFAAELGWCPIPGPDAAPPTA